MKHMRRDTLVLLRRASGYEHSVARCTCDELQNAWIRAGGGGLIDQNGRVVWCPKHEPFSYAEVMSKHKAT